MGQHNDDQDVQNRFTAYLLVALKHRKHDYIQKNTRLTARELLTDFQDSSYAKHMDAELTEELSAMDQIENLDLLEALMQLTEKERRILLGRILDGLGYDELACEWNMNYGGITSVYGRLIRKLRKKLRGK